MKVPLPNPKITNLAHQRRYYGSVYTAEQMRKYAKKCVELEREACSKLCEELADKHGWEGSYATECATAIKARGETK